MSTNQLNDMIEEIKKDVASEAPELKDKIETWGLMIKDIYVLKMTENDPEKMKNLEKDEQYAWDGIQSTKARYAKKVEQGAWKIAEKAMAFVRTLILKVVIGA